MRPALAIAALISAGCPNPHDSASAEDCTRVDETVGSIVWVCAELPTEGTINLHYRVEDEDWRPTLVDMREAGAQELPLLGLPYGAAVDYELKLDGETLTQGSIRTAPLPAGLPTTTLLASDPALYDLDTPWLLTSIDKTTDIGTPEATWVIILDRQGRIVWALETPAFRLTLHPRISADEGAILMDLNSHLGAFDRGAASQVQRVGIDGVVQATWDTPGLHHPYTDLPDGSLAWGAWGDGLETLEILDPTGVQRTLWDCGDYHAAQGLDGTPCSSNTLSWDPGSERFLFSFYTTHTMVEIDGNSGATTRWFGQMPGAWDFDPSDSGFVWQHGGYLTDEGTLLVSMRAPDGADETVAREYTLDEQNLTLHEIWSYGQGQGLYAPELGEATRLPGGNTLLNYGSGTHIREVTPPGTTVWDLRIEDGSLLGRGTPIQDLYGLLAG